MKAPSTTVTRVSAAALAAGSLLTGTALLAHPASGSTTTSITDNADAWVTASSPSTNYGAAHYLQIDNSPTLRGYLRFTISVPAGSSVGSAVLSVLPNQSNSGGFTVHTASSSWTESGITYSNAPAQGTTSYASSGAVTAGSWKSVDVTHAIPTSGGTITLVLDNATATSYSLKSKEYGSSYAPRLAVTLNSSTTTSPTPTPTTSPTSSPTATPTTSPTSSPTTSPTSSPTTSPTSSGGSGGPCGTATTAPATYDHVIWIWFENHSLSEIIGSSSAPYFTSIANQCGLATNYHGITHPSLPNYLAATGGSTFGVTDDNPPSSHPISSASIFSQVKGSGRTWRSYEESMPSNCDLANGTLPAFSFVTPNMCNDMHDCSVSTGDTWLKSWLPKILASSAYQSGRTAIFLTADEDDSTSGNQVLMIPIAPSVPVGARSGSSFNHYSLLRTTEEMLGINSYLVNAATATSMRSAFHL